MNRIGVLFLHPCSLPLCSSSSVGRSPNMLCHLPVSATYMNSACKVFGVVRSFVMFMSLPLMLLCRTCLAAWWAVQCSMKCCTISSLYLHAGQVGELIFPIWCKCLASGACPILSCDKMLANFLGSGVMRLRYLFDGVIRSVCFILSYCQDAAHALCALPFNFLQMLAASLICCMVVSF